MREKIIQYLRGIQCEWFPVEWDPFVYDFFGSIRGHSEADLKNKRIRYEFTDKYLYIVTDGKNKEGISLYYSTLDRCKLLLLNAVRSVDEPKWKGKWGEILYWLHANEDRIWIECKPVNASRLHIVWENGEFK